MKLLYDGAGICRTGKRALNPMVRANPSSPSHYHSSSFSRTRTWGLMTPGGIDHVMLSINLSIGRMQACYGVRRPVSRCRLCAGEVARCVQATRRRDDLPEPDLRNIKKPRKAKKNSEVRVSRGPRAHTAGAGIVAGRAPPCVLPG
jgi:hypothetical protein